MPTDAKQATSDTLYAIQYRHGRADYRAGEVFRPHASGAWQAGWHDEAHLVARSLAAPQMAGAIAGTRALDALEDAARVLRSGVTTRPTLSQANLINAARLTVPDALRRLRESHDPADHEDGASERIPA